MYEALRLYFKGKKAIKLNTVFFGTSEFAGIILEALVRENYNVVGVYTKPEKTVRENTAPKENVVKRIAIETKIPLFQPERIDTEVLTKLRSLKPDIVIVVNYGRMLPKELIVLPGFGCINIHPSLLPEFRGPSPIQNALLEGKKETGTTIMLLNEEMDGGDILAQQTLPIEPKDNAETLRQKLANLSVTLLLETIPRWIQREIEPIPQDPKAATFCQLIDREDGHIVWEKEAENIFNRYRALTPWPGIFSFWRNGGSFLRLKLKKISIQQSDPEIAHDPGTIFEIEDRIGVQTLKGVVFLEEIQMEGKSPCPIQEFINGHPEFIGSVLQ